MSLVEIVQIPYPATDPSENDFEYMCWMTTETDPIAEYRLFTAGDFVLNPFEVVVSFMEEARKEEP